MYKEHFGLKENPFSIAPDPHYFYMSEGHREALAHLIYGLNNDNGFILLTGEVGTGKTMLCRCLIGQMPENTDIAFILNPRLTVEELLASICDEFGIKCPEGSASNKVFVLSIYVFLLATARKGRQAVLIIEEAQNLSTEVLEQIRLLTNLETNKRKLLQIIMLGQPELLDILARDELRQLSQRITARYHLGALSKHEIASYVEHRLRVAGLTKGQLFPPNTVKLLYRLSGGIPRLINVICDRALVGAFVQNKDFVDKKTLLTAAYEVSGDRSKKWRNWRLYGGIAAVCLVLLCISGVLLFFLPKSGPNHQVQTQTAMKTSTPVVVHNMQSGEKNVQTSLSFTGINLSKSLSNAYEALFQMWNIRFDPSSKKSAEEQAGRQGLWLMENNGSLVALRIMNKPVILKLFDRKTNNYLYVTLISLSANQADVAVEGKVKTVAAQELFVVWSGDYIMLWKPPAPYERKLRLGGSGPIVEWVDRYLAMAQRRQMTGKKVYDKELAAFVKEFQKSVGLSPDGTVGPMTIAYLTGMVENEGRVLTNKKSSQ